MADGDVFVIDEASDSESRLREAVDRAGGRLSAFGSIYADFKVGDRVIKARRYSDEDYCRHGGDEDELPLGSEGKIISIQEGGDRIFVEFDCLTEGDSWSLNKNELDLVTRKEEKSLYFLGSKVECIKDFEKIKKGMKGIIQDLTKGDIGVGWDGDFKEGNNLWHKLEGNHGYYIPMKNLKIEGANEKLLTKDTKAQLIIKEIKANKEFSKCFKDVEKEVKSWSFDTINNYELDKNGI